MFGLGTTTILITKGVVMMFWTEMRVIVVHLALWVALLVATVQG